MLLTELNPELIDVKEGLINCSDDESIYLDILETYILEKSDLIVRARKYLEENDLYNYGIVAHGLKSSSHVIGCKKLSSLFKDLETSARGGNYDYCNANSEFALNLYESTCAEISKLFCEETKNELSESEQLEYLNEIGVALDECDVSRAKSLFKVINPYFSETERTELKEIVDTLNAEKMPVFINSYKGSRCM